MARRYELSSEQWQRVASLLPGKAGDPGRSGRDNRLFVNGVLWVLRSGAHWHDVPERYGKWKTQHQRFSRWSKAGVWDRVFADLIDNPMTNDYVMLDSRLVSAHQQAATGKGGDQNQALGRSRGGLTTKIHMGRTRPSAAADPDAWPARRCYPGVRLARRAEGQTCPRRPGL